MRIFKIAIALLLFVTSINANEDILLFKVDNSKGNITPTTIEKTLVKAGYKVEENRDMNGPFKIQFQKTTFETYNLLIAYYPKIMEQLTIKYPNAGIFNPFSVGIYQKKGDKNLYISMLTASAMTRILGGGEKLFKELEALNRKHFLEAIPGGEITKLDYQPIKTAKDLITKFELEVDDEEAEDAQEEVEMFIESGIKPIGFVMASFNSYGTDLEKIKNEDYLYYDIYSLCKLKVIYNVAINHPEAGAYAPCSMAIYHKKGTNKMVIAFPNVYNWISTFALKDKKLIAILEKAQADITTLIESAIE
jgi:uncharacterized protein (DUF302 family)